LKIADSSGLDSVRKAKNMIGIAAILLLLVFTVLAVIGILPPLAWIIADLIVALVANIAFKRVGQSR
jgi:exosortase/archaeosortase